MIDRARLFLQLMVDVRLRCWSIIRCPSLQQPLLVAVSNAPNSRVRHAVPHTHNERGACGYPASILTCAPFLDYTVIDLREELVGSASVPLFTSGTCLVNPIQTVVSPIHTPKVSILANSRGLLYIPVGGVFVSIEVQSGCMGYCVIYRATPEDHNITRRDISKDARFPIRIQGREWIQPQLIPWIKKQSARRQVSR
jgi:hypothetical protein